MRKVIVKGSWIIAAAVVAHVSPLAMAEEVRLPRPSITQLAEEVRLPRPSITQLAEEVRLPRPSIGLNSALA